MCSSFSLEFPIVTRISLLVCFQVSTLALGNCPFLPILVTMFILKQSSALPLSTAFKHDHIQTCVRVEHASSISPGICLVSRVREQNQKWIPRSFEEQSLWVLDKSRVSSNLFSNKIDIVGICWDSLTKLFFESFRNVKSAKRNINAEF